MRKIIRIYLILALRCCLLDSFHPVYFSSSSSQSISIFANIGIAMDVPKSSELSSFAEVEFSPLIQEKRRVLTSISFLTSLTAVLSVYGLDLDCKKQVDGVGRLKIANAAELPPITIETPSDEINIGPIMGKVGIGLKEDKEIRRVTVNSIKEDSNSIVKKLAKKGMILVSITSIPTSVSVNVEGNNNYSAFSP